jgi:acyl-CoA hydrolase
MSHLHFVAVDDTGRPVEVPQIIPETELEQERFDAALRQDNSV